MNWAECSRASESIYGWSRFDWPPNGLAGINCQDGVTLSDITGALGWVWTYPSDYLLRLPKVNMFLELDPLHTGGTLSMVISGGIAFLGVCILAAALDGFGRY